MSKDTTTEVIPGAGDGDSTSPELTGRDQPRAGSIEIALARNRAFAAAGRHEGAVVVPNLRLFAVTCLDPRVDPAHFLGLQLSDAIVVRNSGGGSPRRRSTTSRSSARSSRTSDQTARCPRSP